jgi:hypothetical protein
MPPLPRGRCPLGPPVPDPAPFPDPGPCTRPGSSWPAPYSLSDTASLIMRGLNLLVVASIVLPSYVMSFIVLPSNVLALHSIVIWCSTITCVAMSCAPMSCSIMGNMNLLRQLQSLPMLTSPLMCIAKSIEGYM